MALRAAIFMALMGKDGLIKLAVVNLSLAEYAKKILGAKAALKFKAPTFNEFALRLGKDAEKKLDALNDMGIFAGLPLGRWYPELGDSVLVTLTELNAREDIDKLAGKLPV